MVPGNWHSTPNFVPISHLIYWRISIFPGKNSKSRLAISLTHLPTFEGGKLMNPDDERFHGLFSKKKRSKSGGVPSFPRREHVPAVISLPSGQPTALDAYHEIT